MHKINQIKWFALACIFCLVAVAAPAHALPDWIKKQLHKEEDYKILIVKGDHASADVNKLVAAPKDTKIVVWQALPQDTKAADTDRVMQWVNDGGSLWFQDCRLAAAFGLQPNPLVKGDLKEPSEMRKGNKEVFKDTAGEYGGIKKFPGLTTLAIAPPGQAHPVLQGVDTAQVFLIKVGEGQYSSVLQTPGMVPLLKMDIVTANPLSKKVIAGLVKCGKGIVVFKPLFWSEQLTGDRLQCNLLEFSAGYGVPNPAGPGSYAP